VEEFDEGRGESTFRFEVCGEVIVAAPEVLHVGVP
jgi:hypothetical protein